jgi:hypothetical protein
MSSKRGAACFWKEGWPASGPGGGDPEARVVKQARAKVGELAMKLELAEMRLERRGYGDELARLKKSRGL